MKWAKYLIKQALGGSALQAKMTRPFTQPAIVPKVQTLEDIRTAEELMNNLPPSPKRVPLARVRARLGVN